MPAGVSVAPLHEAAPQAVPADIARQAPAPSQVPLNPQGGVAAQPPCGSIAPAGTGLQRPALPVTLHEAQVPQLADEQQTPSTQLPPSHSLPAAQIWPRRFLPHEPALQTVPATQSASLAHAALHAVPLQLYGAHDCVVAGLHAPAPSQLRASGAVVAPAGHDGGAHSVPAAYSWQPPAPSQTPVVAQLAAPWSRHWPAGSRSPAATGTQLPALPMTAHDMQVPAQAVLQQAPCAQIPLAHSLPAPQTAPSFFRPQDPPPQTAGGAQSASAVHVALHAATPQRNGKQEVAAGVRQVPAPSQLPAGVRVVVPDGQVAGLHAVPCG